MSIYCALTRYFRRSTKLGAEIAQMRALFPAQSAAQNSRQESARFVLLGLFGHYPPESQVRTRLRAGGRWIRTIGPCREGAGYIAKGEFARGSTGGQKNLAGYRWFESISLQRRVVCEPEDDINILVPRATPF